MTEQEEAALSLAEFVALPTTVEAIILNTGRAKRYVEQTPYIKSGRELASGYIPIYTNSKNIGRVFKEMGSDFISFFPQILSPLDRQSNEDAGIGAVIDHPYLGLSGRGVVVGIIDTGIDYTREIFRNLDRSTKIISIWDQSIDGPRRDDLYYGAEFSREEIDEALLAEHPFDVVPTRDTSGHGTFLASLAAGSRTRGYVGAAPDAELIVVKLRRANPYYITKHLLPDEENLFSSIDVMLGAQYIIERAEERNLPVALCIGLGSNMSGHDGNTPLEDYLSLLSQRVGNVTVTAGGNESNARHHTQGIIEKTGATDVISIRVGERSSSFTLGIYGESFDRISVGITSPTGEVISRIPFKAGLQLRNEMTIDRTTVTIGYYQDVNSVIVVGFEGAKEGIWEVTLYGDYVLSGQYFAWLPITNQVSPFVEFMRPVPEYTIVFPATSLRTITCGAYNSQNDTLYVSSSWGPTRLTRMTPDFVAPGVNVTGIYPDGPGTMTGTSAAAAITTGAVAILLEWGLVQGNMRSMDGDTVRLLLISGCRRDEGILYPNTRWGFGKLDLYGTFFKIKETSISYDMSGG